MYHKGYHEGVCVVHVMNVIYIQYLTCGSILYVIEYQKSYDTINWCMSFRHTHSTIYWRRSGQMDAGNAHAEPLRKQL